ncbi:ubiquitin-conjugating enzyme E2-binding protein [Cadophora sp. MPI-SDFR-AT-0126]|nr:ubiquitin-conjugating enzyme E2-binding protein [Leotiomycetes sp. MPI-SDFR-AT-0126]
MSPTTQALIYAELLSNIGQISVIVALDAPCGDSTKAELSADGRQFILYHDGNAFTLNLPGQAVLVQLQKPVPGNKELSWRIPIAGQATRASIEDSQSNEAPWSAKELSEDAEFACRNCAAIILKKGTIKVWKDLPSENWAEMMEFWHCHKPAVPAEEANGSNWRGHVHHYQTASSKGYGASSRFIASKSVGLIDLTTFLLTSNDCTNIEAVPSPISDPASILCKSCHRNIGREDPQSDGIRLFKWSLTLLSSSPPSFDNPSLAVLLSSQCLSSSQATGVSKLILSPRPLFGGPTTTPDSSSCAESRGSSWNVSSEPTAGATSQTGPNANSVSPSGPMLVWVFKSALYFCGGTLPLSSAHGTSSTTPKLAMKVFWKPISTNEARSLLDDGNAEELILPDEIVVEVGGILRDSACCLPPSARKFKEWNVGLLERYQPSH